MTLKSIAVCGASLLHGGGCFAFSVVSVWALKIDSGCYDSWGHSSASHPLVAESLLGLNPTQRLPSRVHIGSGKVISLDSWGAWGRLLSTLLTTLIYLLKTLALWPSFSFFLSFPNCSVFMTLPFRTLLR